MSSTTTVNVFYTGATGYIGGEVLKRLLEHKNASMFKITALVRSKEKAAKLNALGVETVIGSYDDADKLEDGASKADLVIATADADHMEATKAMLRGMKRRFDATGKPTLFVHTSGTGVLHDDACGLFSTDVIYDDANTNQIESLAPTQLHRLIDLEIIAADRAGYIRSFIVAPSTIYGLATGRLVDEGIQNPRSAQIPKLIRASLAYGQAVMFGPGKNIWNDVHIDDLGELYILLIDSALSNPDTPHGREGFYIGENGEHYLYQISEEIAKVLVELGKTETTAIKSFTKEEAIKHIAPTAQLDIGSNSRGRASRARSLGWKPTRTTNDMLASIKPEIEAILAGV